MAAVAEQQKPAAVRVQDVTGGQPVRSGAKLVKALKASGTPDAKLQPAREALAAAGKDLPAADVIAALEAADAIAADAGTTRLTATVKKAEALAATGKLPVAEAARTIEDVILGEPKKTVQKPAPAAKTAAADDDGDDTSPDTGSPPPPDAAHRPADFPKPTPPKK